MQGHGSIPIRLTDSDHDYILDKIKCRDKTEYERIFLLTKIMSNHNYHMRKQYYV